MESLTISYVMLSDIGLCLCGNVLCSMAFTFHISNMKWSNVTGLEGENITGHWSARSSSHVGEDSWTG